ncbi:outer membrane beta-barrel protein [Gaoshiqia sp. Z1-71]|uniref:outer membrane beta-barrel protein n=1 Tax=Gaoshiqia hydrogeniformans TaxID=3290090 RepID=UPI003BF8FB18
MKNAMCLLVLIALSVGLFGQGTERKGYIGLSLGPAFPVGDFAGKSVDEGGFAKIGLNLCLVNFGYKFGENFGIAGLWSGSAHNFDMYGIDGDWAYGSLMAGPMMSMPLSGRVDLDLKWMVGLVSARFEPNDFGKEDGEGFGWDLGASLRYHFTEKWSLLVNADYFSAKPKFKTYGVESEQKISAINVHIGIAYRLR